MELFFTGIGNTLDPDFSFVKIAAPYAQVLYVYTEALFMFVCEVLESS